MLAVPLGYSFDLVRFGHLMHHVETGHALDRPDRAADPIWRSVVRHYLHLLGGHYAMTVLIAWAAFVPWQMLWPRLQRRLHHAPSVRDAAARWFGHASRRAAIRTDVAAAFACAALSAYLYAGSWPWLLLALYGRALLLSVMDNMPHYGTDGSDLLQVPAFRVPRWLPGLVMNHHLHRIHHLRPTLPWRALSAAFAQTGRGYDDTYCRGILRQFRGPSRV